MRRLFFVLISSSFIWQAVYSATLCGSAVKGPNNQAAYRSARYNLGQVEKMFYTPKSQAAIPALFRVKQLNFENLFEDSISFHERRPKPKKKRGANNYTPPQKSAKELMALYHMSFGDLPELLLGNELENSHVMKIFEDKYVKDRYEELLIDGNDTRGIDVGLFIRKDLPFHVEVRSHKNMQDKNFGTGPIFRRDAPAFIFRTQPGEKPFLVIIGIHFKSQRRIENGDQAAIRGAEAEAAQWLAKQFELEFGEVPVLISGDQNNDVHRAKELASYKSNKFADALDLGGYRGPRHTHFYFNGSQPQFSQLDATMVNETAQRIGAVIKAEVQPQRDEMGNDLPDPRSFHERQDRATDHKASLITLSTRALLPMLP